MSLLPRKPSGAKKQGFNYGAFVGLTTIAIVASIALIVLGRISSSQQRYFATVPESALPNYITSPATTPQEDSNIPPAIFTGISKGLPSAPITILLFTDFQCSKCQNFALTIEKELEKAYIDTGKVRLIFKNYIVFGDESIMAAQAAEYAASENKFWPFYDLLMQQRASHKVGDLTVDKLKTLALQVGLDVNELGIILESDKYKDKIMKDKEDGKALGVIGTPTFFINGIKGTGDPPFESFREVIEALLKGTTK